MSVGYDGKGPRQEACAAALQITVKVRQPGILRLPRAKSRSFGCFWALMETLGSRAGVSPPRNKAEDDGNTSDSRGDCSESENEGLDGYRKGGRAVAEPSAAQAPAWTVCMRLKPEAAATAAR